MGFILKYWRLIAMTAIVVAALAFGWWVSSLLGRIDTLKEENRVLHASVIQRDTYIALYETARKANEQETARLIDLTRNIQNDPNCNAPADFRAVIDSL